MHQLLCSGYTDVVDADLPKYLDTASYCPLVRARQPALQERFAVAGSVNAASMGTPSTAQPLVLVAIRNSQRPLSAGTHHRCLGFRRILPYSAGRGKESVNRQALDELKQQIPLWDYLQNTSRWAAAPT